MGPDHTSVHHSVETPNVATVRDSGLNLCAGCLRSPLSAHRIFPCASARRDDTALSAQAELLGPRRAQMEVPRLEWLLPDISFIRQYGKLGKVLIVQRHHH